MTLAKHTPYSVPVGDGVRRAAHQPLPFAPRRRMIGWFDPRLLALTGIQAVVSQTFGS